MRIMGTKANCPLLLPTLVLVIIIGLLQIHHSMNLPVLPLKDAAYLPPAVDMSDADAAIC
jgi:hypothetical protein